MSRYSEPEAQALIAQLNSELQHAQLELLSAHCATHQLRLRYSAEDLIRFGRRDILQKSAQAASDLHRYYAAIEREIPSSTPPAPEFPQISRNQMQQAIHWLASYLGEQRDHYRSIASPLSGQYKHELARYFSAALLNRIRIAELKGARVTAPDFFSHARA